MISFTVDVEEVSPQDAPADEGGMTKAPPTAFVATTLAAAVSQADANALEVLAAAVTAAAQRNRGSHLWPPAASVPTLWVIVTEGGSRSAEAPSATIRCELVQRCRR